MTNNPEMPFLASGVIALLAGFVREGKFPSEGIKAIIATVVLVIVASSTANTDFASLVRAIGLLVLMVTIIAAVPAFRAKKEK